MPEARKELPLALRHGWIAFTPFPLVLFTLIVLFAGLCSSNPGRVGPVLSNRVSPERDPPPPERIPEMEAFFTGDAQAVCRYKFCGSKPTPFFRIVKVIVAILRASVRRAIVGRIPFSTRAT